MAKEKKIKESKQVQTVTRLPGWLLKLKGRLDSRKGQTVCDEYIRQLNKRLASMETNEVIAVEHDLFEARKKAATLLMEILEHRGQFSELPENQNEDSVEAIRMNRKNDQQKKTLEMNMTGAVKELTAIRETIISAETVLDERINKLRNEAAEKIHIYVTGIRCGRLKDYEFDLSGIDNSAREIYTARHEKLDEKIRVITDFDAEEEGLA